MIYMYYIYLGDGYIFIEDDVNNIDSRIQSYNTYLLRKLRRDIISDFVNFYAILFLAKLNQKRSNIRTGSAAYFLLIGFLVNFLSN